MRYFKTLSPLIGAHYLSGGRVVKWKTFDGVLGWFATEDPVIASALVAFGEKKIGGGISEVPQSEYEAAMGKTKGLREIIPDREWVDRAGVRPNPLAENLSAPPAAVAEEKAQEPPKESPAAVTRKRKKAK